LLALALVIIQPGHTSQELQPGVTVGIISGHGFLSLTYSLFQ